MAEHQQARTVAHPGAYGTPLSHAGETDAPAAIGGGVRDRGPRDNPPTNRRVGVPRLLDRTARRRSWPRRCGPTAMCGR